jgi:threonine/homoserine/homoserine lactone efflux protein
MLFLYGLLVGAIVAAPTGPVGIASVTQVVRGHLRTALAIMAGCILAEVLNSTAAVFGSAHYSDLLNHPPAWVYLAAGLLLTGAGIWYLATHPEPGRRDYAFAGAFGATMLNIHIPNLMLVLTMLGLPPLFTSTAAKLVFIGGEVLAVGVVWALLLALVQWRQRHGQGWRHLLPWLHRATGLALIGLGLYTLAEGFL